MTDPFNLQRFIDAQTPVYSRVLQELRTGHKLTHWMWFVFPQLKNLGHSPMARHYAIASLAEAAAYLEHPVLGPRLLECTGLMLATQGKTAAEILGSTDSMKFCSCLTLFKATSPALPLWAAALNKYYEGNPDAATLPLLGRP